MIEPTYIVTSPGIKARYEEILKAQQRARAAAAEEWYNMRWWQWRKRRRLERVLFSVGGWRVPLANDIYEVYVPRRIR